MSEAIALTESEPADADARTEALESRVRALEAFVLLVSGSHQDQLTALAATAGALAGLLARQNDTISSGQAVVQAIADHLGVLDDHEAAGGPQATAGTPAG